MTLARRVVCGLVGLAMLMAIGMAWAGPDARLAALTEEARQAYDAGDYSEALRLYRQVHDAGWSSPELLYNLGCAAERAGLTGWAVAYLEDARRWSPRDPSIRHNLRIARERVRDRVAGESNSWVLSAVAGLLDAIAPADIIRILLACGWLAAIGLALQWHGPAGWRGLLRPVFIGLAAAAILAGATLALKAYQISTAPSGVVVAEEIEVLAGPRAGERAQFVLHAGTPVHLGRSAGGWREVWLSDQMRGWAPVAGIAPLRPFRWAP